MSDTLVATPDPPDDTPITTSGTADVEIVEAVEVLVPCTPVQVIDHYLDQTRFRNTVAADEVVNMLLDVRNAL